MQPEEQDTARLVVLSLLSHCRDLLGSDIHTASRSRHCSKPFAAISKNIMPRR
jgi:hypothetical protein